MERDSMEIKVKYRAQNLNPGQRQYVLNLIQDLNCKIIESNDGTRLNLSIVPMEELRHILRFIEAVTKT